MRARSPLAAMAVMGSMREGKSTASANRGRERQVSQKTVNPAEERDREAANFAPRFWRRWRGGQFSAAPWGRKSLKTRLAAFGLRAAIPAAWLLYPHRHRCLLDFSRCVRNVGQRLEPHRDSRRKLRRAPRARPPPGNFQDCWLAWWAQAARSKARSAPVRRKAHRHRAWRRRLASRHCSEERTHRSIRRRQLPNLPGRARWSPKPNRIGIRS